MAWRHLTTIFLFGIAITCGGRIADSQELAPRTTAEPPANADMERLARRIEPELDGPARAIAAIH